MKKGNFHVIYNVIYNESHNKSKKLDLYEKMKYSAKSQNQNSVILEK